MKGHLIVFEGICCSGKTTIFNPICEQFPVVKLQESFYAATDPPPPPTTPAEAIRNDAYYLALDEQRWQAATAIVNSGRHLLAERCVLGTISICYGYQPIYRSYPAAMDVLMKSLERGWFAAPTAYLWFKTDLEVIQTRLRDKQARRHLVGEGWTHPEALELQHQLLERYFAITKTPVYIIDGNASLSERMEAVYSRIRSILHEPAHDVYPDPLAHSRQMIRFLQRSVDEMNERGCV
ncbi:hypothetical protein [Paenibacillus sp. 598K]|uniref:hypothetical protein n=1 Tax=Paenibacillus sp. 598K TaxID=1117987 RepID=UPI000FFF2C00|nr:hypothetical protein [Paenibacillus sp. 598K]